MNAPYLSDRKPEAREDVIDIGQLLATLRAGWKLICLLIVVAMGSGYVYVSYIATPIYTAKAVVVLDTRSAQVIDLEGMMGGLSGDSNELNTEAQVLKSRGLAEKVVDDLALISDPEFNVSLREPSFLAQIKTLLGAAQTEKDAVAEKAEVVTAFLENLNVRLVPASFVLDISVRSEDPRKAALLADTVAKRYILNQIEVKFEATEQATAWLTNRVAELKTGLEGAEEKLKAFNAQTTLVSEVTLSSLEAQLKDMRERLMQVAEQEQQLIARLVMLEQTTDVDAQIQITGDPELERLRGKGTGFAARYRQLLLRAKLEATRATDQRNAIEKSLQTLKQQAAEQGEDLIVLQQLAREAEASRTLYEYFLSRLKETSAQQGVQQADSRQLSDAVIPSEPSEPRKNLVLVMSGILGAMVGVGVILFREANRKGYRTARQLEEDSGIVVMGQIPLIPGKGRMDILEYLSTKSASAAMEAVRNLRTSVLLSNVDKPPQVIISTSSIPGEGKTTNSLALALNLVGTGRKVLLIEGDIRRNTLAEYFAKSATKKGLISVLSGDAKLDDAIEHHEKLGLSVIAGERSTINAADLFMSEAWRGLLAELRTRFDYIIIDTPPVLVVPDARIIAQTADAVLFTVRWNATNRHQVQEALRMFETVNKKVAGLVLSQIDGAEMKRYGYGGKYAGYGAYSAYGAKYYVE